MNRRDEIIYTHLALILVVHAMGPVALLQLLADVARGVELQRQRDGLLLPGKRGTGNVVSNLQNEHEMRPNKISPTETRVLL